MAISSYSRMSLTTYSTGTKSNEKAKATDTETNKPSILNLKCGGDDDNAGMQEIYDYKGGKSEMVTYDDQGKEKHTQTAKPDGSWGKPTKPDKGNNPLSGGLDKIFDKTFSNFNNLFNNVFGGEGMDTQACGDTSGNNGTKKSFLG